ncbi:nitroreductase family protein [Ornithinimicrobium flavum]|uniref:nitroreductase family protein n=1 Tax=Ornithinimicrobium flavum TaxID=1288636 RepID=UPI00106FED4B|nr:nitroreductase family protein [Ornithinimicrobium flavum]
MELREVVGRRRMCGPTTPGARCPPRVVRRALAHALRAPSAGFSQGWDFLVLDDPADRERFWTTTAGEVPEEQMDSWLRGVRTAPVLILCLSDPDRYLDRYAEPDKGRTDRSPAHWPIPYWDVDTGMAALLILLTAVDEGLGALFFGVPPTRHAAVRAAFGVPEGRRLVGVVSLGYAVPHRRSRSLRRGRRPFDEVVHGARFGTPWSG